MTFNPEWIETLLALADEDERFRADLVSWWNWRHKGDFDARELLERTLLGPSEFRSLVNYRLLEADKLPINFGPYRLANDLYIRTPSIGGGFRIQHGHSTWILAASIGDNFHVNQNVTIGEARGRPTIGNNVRIATGAVVVGPITIGDGVVIAPNAFVNFDVPSGKKVFPARSVIVG